MPTILIIDDYDLLLAALRLALEEDYTVFTAQSGKEALGMMELIQPDLVITDLNMPGMSGLELIEYIVRARSPRPGSGIGPKIILYTARLTPGLIAYVISVNYIF
ncbi:response regulator, partial [bacterium]|nr:response regulator [bacterium]